MLLWGLLLFLNSGVGGPIPIGSRDAPKNSAWVSEPPGRGTWGLVQSCLLTLGLCMYTAVHINIAPNESKGRTLSRRLRSSLVAAVIPEYILLNAYKEWASAKSLQRQVNDLRVDDASCDVCSKLGLGDAQSPKGSKPQDSTSTQNEPNTQPVDPTKYLPPRSDVKHLSIPCDKPLTSIGATNNIFSSETYASDVAAAEKPENSFLFNETSLTSSTPLGPEPKATDVYAGKDVEGVGESNGNCHHHFDSESARHPVTLREKPSPSTETPAPRPERVAWTLQQAYFIVAGGLAVDSSSFWKKPCMVFTPLGALELAKAGLLPEISPEMVEDKNKADSISKILVCVQVGWYIIQCTARLVQKLPLTLLEVHTLIHVLLAFIMYLFWFAKPYDVRFPFVETNSEVIQMAALLELQIGGQPLKERCCCQKHLVNTDLVLTKHLRGSGLDSFKQRWRLWWPRPSAAKTHLTLANKAVKRLKTRGCHFTWVNDHTTPPMPPEYFRRYGDFVDTDEGLLITTSLRLAHPSFGSEALSYAYLIPLFVPYGALHLCAWHAYFPTSVECWIWRASGLSLIGVPFLMIAMNLVRDYLKSLNSTDRVRFTAVLSSFLDIWKAITIGLCFTVFGLARLYPLVEAFASLRKTPPRTYETVEWTNFLPHA